jgi:hypothetical protein
MTRTVARCLSVGGIVVGVSALYSAFCIKSGAAFSGVMASVSSSAPYSAPHNYSFDGCIGLAALSFGFAIAFIVVASRTRRDVPKGFDVI